MDLFEVAPIAYAGCAAVLADLSPADLGRPTPCPEFTVADLLDHLHLAMVRLGGLAGAELRVEDDLPDLVTGALEAWRTRGLDGTVDLRGPIPAPRAADIIPLEFVIHGWDVATAVGRPYSPDADVVAYLLKATRDIVPARRGRAFGPAVTAPDGASPLQQLIAFTGRDPS